MLPECRSWNIGPGADFWAPVGPIEFMGRLLVRVKPVSAAKKKKKKKKSSPSKYDIQINYSVNQDIEFSIPQIEKFLKIHGKILKNCAKNLAVPLALLFQTSYY